MNVVPEFFVAKHKADDVLMKSTSGGAFTAISDVILHQGGDIYGADYDQEFRVVHKQAENEEQRNRMRISKYVQSDLGKVFQMVESDLKNHKVVLFTGTPCQIAGLRGYLGKSPLIKNLYLCDLICHSIPSPLIWNDYKNILEKEYGGKLIDVQFRTKAIDWNNGNKQRVTVNGSCTFTFTPPGGPANLVLTFTRPKMPHRREASSLEIWNWGPGMVTPGSNTIAFGAPASRTL